MKIRLLAAACCVVSSAFAQDITWAELARRSELWPAQCTLKATIKFQGAAPVPAGQKVNVLQVTPTEVQLATLDARTTFAADPDETDVLAVARAAYAQLTPKQRAVTLQSLPQQKELWPATVRLNKTFDLGSGRVLRAGDELMLLNVVDPGKLLVQSNTLRMTTHVTPQATDFVAQVRQIAENPEARPRFVVAEKQRQDALAAAAQKKAEAEQQRLALEERKRVNGVVVTELEGKLLNTASGKPQPLDPDALPKYIVFYRGSSTCPITREFTPTLIKFYQQMKPQHPEFEIVYIMTESVEDTGKFAQELGFSWRGITYESTPTMPTVDRPVQGLLPQLFVMDRSGRLLANGWQSAAPNALKQLDALLKATTR